MIDCEEKTKSIVKPAFATSFIPRQLLLICSSSKLSMTLPKMENGRKTTISLTSQDRVVLLHTICQFLQLNGFNKTLKKFCGESDIQKDSWKNCSLNLEEIFQEHLWKRNATNETDKSAKKNGVDNEKSKAALENQIVNGDEIKPRKKKIRVDDMADQVNTETHVKTSEKTVGRILSEPADAAKKSKKKKQKDASILSDKDLSEHPDGVDLSMPSVPVKKSKDKKKKHKDESQVFDKDLQENNAAVEAEATKKSDSVSVEQKKVKSKRKRMEDEVSVSKDEVDEEGKCSKKRKKLNDAADYVDETVIVDSICKKLNGSDNSKGADQPPKTPKGTTNEFMEKDGGDEAQEQYETKECNGSVEPTTAKAFQRVKADEVAIDERLRDNSYWAKDGADSGYGAKAEEVLGQFRGRGFRHEKTKKKRGTYRGGKIDFLSHSIKFNHDDDE